MADLSTITYIEDFLTDSLAVLSLVILLFVLRKITDTLSKFKGSDNKELVDFIQKSSAETLNAINESLDIFLKHMEKLDILLHDQEAYCTTCNTMILKQEEIIKRQEIMIKNQGAIMDKLKTLYEKDRKQEVQETPIKIASDNQ